ncbi:MAG: pyruvate, phosphate dikinase/phosphoenolpyruvate synthase regulator [Deltaproteobacteria bacterium]|jgi:regulator of PEP synthase PpsR (kinase-PPPase family)
MWKSKDVYFISDSTGILISNLAHALLCQFPEINFHEEKFPFVRTIGEAQKTLAYILRQSGGRRPLVFSTITDPRVREIFDSPEVEFFDAFDFFLKRLENCLEAKALRVPGFSRQKDLISMADRVEAIHFCLEHDDGTKIQEFEEADVIMLGVSRSGKTPVSVYLATEIGLKAANFPLTAEYLDQYRMPDHILRHSKRAVGLTTSPELLHAMREKRYSGSRYARLATCKEELRQAEQIFESYHIPVVHTAGKSIEEIATQVLQEIGLSKKLAALNNHSS